MAIHGLLCCLLQEIDMFEVVAHAMCLLQIFSSSSFSIKHVLLLCYPPSCSCPITTCTIACLAEAKAESGTFRAHGANNASGTSHASTAIFLQTPQYFASLQSSSQ